MEYTHHQRTMIYTSNRSSLTFNVALFQPLYGLEGVNVKIEDFSFVMLGLFHDQIGTSFIGLY